MKPIELELERTVRAPIDQVFARLVDIEGHNDWEADTGSMLMPPGKEPGRQPIARTTDNRSQRWRRIGSLLRT